MSKPFLLMCTLSALTVALTWVSCRAAERTNDALLQLDGLLP